jgi:ATP-binding cassette subfamily B (MDR/TAP) protein 1
MAADSSTTGSATKHNKTIQTEEEQQYASQMGWGVLFTFTTRKHLPVMLGAILTAAVSAATLPVFSIIYGLIFNSYADYGAGNIDGDELLRDVTRYCLILTGVATANWIMNSTSFFLMLIFGELQAKSARTRVFDVLIRKDITWFDLRESGIAAFLPTIQS